jgi:DNA-binding transcriptional LysR family regulator
MQDVHVAAFDWNLLLAFDALFAERNVTRAARRIGLSQSAMSHALGRLRQQIGDPLFLATPRGMVPTPRAVALEKPLREAVQLVRRTLETPPAFDPRTEASTFTVSTTDFGALVILPPLLRDLASRAPLIDLAIRPSDETSIGHLVSGEHDLALSVGAAMPPGVRGVRIFQDDFVCVRHRPRGKRLPRLTLARYLATPHLLVSPLGRGDAPVDIALRRIGKKRRIALRLPHFLVAPLVLAHCDFVMTVPSRLAAVFGELLPVQKDEPPIPISGFSVDMLWHERREEDPAHRFLRERVIAVVG